MEASRSRRNAAIHFTTCNATVAIPGEMPAGGRRRQVVVAGRRVKTVDVHAHCIIPEAIALVEGARMPRGKDGKIVIADDRLRDMDEQGIDVEVLSVNPFWYGCGREVAEAVCRLQNEKLAELCAASTGRFAAFATVAPQFPDLAVQQLDHAVRHLGLRGVSLGTEVNQWELADPQLHPFWARVEELGVLVFLHPPFGPVPELAGRLKGKGHLSNVIGNPLATTLALSHLIFEGTLDRFPGLKICSAHGGGYLPSYAHRSDRGAWVSSSVSDPGVSLRQKPSDYLRQLYYDSLVFTPEALRHLAAEVGTGQIMLGTDHPFPWQKEAVEHVLATPELDDAARRAILGETACRLLGIPLLDA